MLDYEDYSTFDNFVKDLHLNRGENVKEYSTFYCSCS